MNSIHQILAQDNPLIAFYVGSPAQAEARLIAGRWTEAKDRAMRAADTVEAGNVTRLKPNVYQVVDLDTEETHTVAYSTFNETGGYVCDCGDWFGGVMGFPEAAPYPKDWPGCSPMCVHVLAVDIGLQIEAVEDEIPFRGEPFNNESSESARLGLPVEW